MSDDNNQSYIPDEEMKLPEEGPLVVDEPIHKSTHLIAIIGIAILILILTILALYLFDRNLEQQAINAPQVTRPSAEENQEPESANARADVTALDALSPSDEISAIEADLESTLLSDIDTELQAIETELEN